MTAPDWVARAVTDTAGSADAAAPAANSGCAGTPPADSTGASNAAPDPASVTGDLSTGPIDQATVGPKVAIDPVKVNMQEAGVPGGIVTTVSAQACLSQGSENLMLWLDFGNGSTATAVGRVVGIDNRGGGNGTWLFSGPVTSYTPGHTGVEAVTHTLVAEIQTAEPDNTASLSVAFIPDPPPGPGSTTAKSSTGSTQTTPPPGSSSAPAAG